MLVYVWGIYNNNLPQDYLHKELSNSWGACWNMEKDQIHKFLEISFLNRDSIS